MAKDVQKLRRIYAKTDGQCHVCHRKLSFQNHGKWGQRGAWHVDHSVAKARGGSDHMNNLLPACIGCNLDKATISSRTIRKYYGTTRAPYCREKKQRIREDNTTTGALIGGMIGLIGGPWGVVIGATIGGMIGNDNSPNV